MSEIVALHQVLTGATAGDAITQHACDIQRWLRARAIESHIYALHIHESMAKTVRPLASYHPAADERLVIYHHSIGSEVPDFLLARHPQILMIYHNITPPEFFAWINPAWWHQARQGQEQLVRLRTKTVLALAVSAYNRKDLLAAGYEQTGILPIALPAAQYDLPINKALAATLATKRPLLLFVGRFAPNKKQEDLVKLLAYFRRIQPNAHLALVGDPWIIGYDAFVGRLAADLELSDALIMTGKVSQQDLVTYYRTADLYVSMSEHEGFGKPLIESMQLGLPVVAYAAAGVAETMGKSGIRVHIKDFERLAELLDLILADEGLRQRLAKQQLERVSAFLEPEVRGVFNHCLDTILPLINAGEDG